jgi:dihydrofolate synthase / folylpolyglutamate synthase
MIYRKASMSRFDSLSAWLEWQESLHPRPIDLGLQRSEAVFAKLNPHAIKPITITVTGTNGKGSTVAFLEAVYKAQGYKVGTYTSPHILKYNERIKINGQPVGDAEICTAFERIDAARADVSLSYFEFGTLAALDIFIRAEVDIQLLEVGLGGRLDVVNIVDADVAIISSIDIDHVNWLGNTRESIGREKAGIFRAHIPCIIGDANPPQSVFEVANEKQAKLFCINQDFAYQKSAQNWHWQGGEQRYDNLPYPVLKGEHQFSNVSCVLFALTQLQNRLPVSEQSIHHGLENAELKGRFQLCYHGDIPVLVDVAHNPQAVKTLVAYLDENFAGKKIHAVFAMMKDKDIDSVIELIKAKISDWFIAPLTTSRAADSEMLNNILQQHGISQINSGFENCTAAFQTAAQQATEDDLILIFGSFYLVSDYLAFQEQIAR